MRRKGVFFWHDVILLCVWKVLMNKFTIVTLTNHNLFDFLLLHFLNVHVVQCRICEHWEFITDPLIGSFIQPLVLWTMALEFSFQPWIDRSEMEFNVMIKLWLELVWIKDLDCSFLPSCTDWLSFAQVNLYVHYPVWERFQFCVVVSRTVKNQVSWFQIWFCQLFVWKQVELVRLVPLSQSVAKILSEIKYGLTNQGTAVKKKWSIVEFISGLMVSLSIWDANILFGSFDKLFSELLFELRIFSIDLNILEVLIEFELIELFFLELFEGILNGETRSMLSKDLVLFIGGVGDFHNFKFYRNQFE